MGAATIPSMVPSETPQPGVRAAAPQPLTVVAAAVVQDGELLVVSKRAAPHLFYLPGGKPDPGEAPVDTLARELAEELGVAPVDPRFLARVEAVAALEGVPMWLSVFTAGLDGTPHPTAELAELRWISGRDPSVQLSPALTGHVLPLLRREGLLGR